jgi:hypothetical protein
MLMLLYFIIISELEHIAVITPVNIPISTFLFYTTYTL